MKKEDRIDLLAELMSDILDNKGDSSIYMNFVEETENYSQVNIGIEGNTPTVKLLQGDKLKTSLRNIVNLYIKDEMTHWEEENYPKDHIYNDLKLVKDILNL